MALDFGGLTDEFYVNWGTMGASNMAVGTYVVWINKATVAGEQPFFVKGADVDAHTFNAQFSSGTPQFIRNRATQTCLITATSSIIVNGIWTFLAVAWDARVGSVDGEQFMWHGDVNTRPTQITYSDRQAGSGDPTDITGDNLYSGDLPGAGFEHGYDGLMKSVAHWDRRLAEWEIVEQWYKTHPTRGSQLYSELGKNGASLQIDQSGRGNHGTVTGATVAQSQLLDPRFAEPLDSPLGKAPAVAITPDMWHPGIQQPYPFKPEVIPY